MIRKSFWFQYVFVVFPSLTFKSFFFLQLLPVETGSKHNTDILTHFCAKSNLLNKLHSYISALFFWIYNLSHNSRKGFLRDRSQHKSHNQPPACSRGPKQGYLPLSPCYSVGEPDQGREVWPVPKATSLFLAETREILLTVTPLLNVFILTAMDDYKLWWTTRLSSASRHNLNCDFQCKW